MLASLPPSDRSLLATKTPVPHPAATSLSSKEVKAELKMATDSPESSDTNASTKVGALQSFAHGALGLAEPNVHDTFCESKSSHQDSSQGYFKAGQLLKAAATVGSVIALFV
jgi:hypothetical protein